VDFPEGMQLTQRRQGNRLLISISLAQGEKKLETLISTLDEIVSHIYSATKTLEQAESA
jgi:hypothetical protein